MDHNNNEKLKKQVFVMRHGESLFNQICETNNRNEKDPMIFDCGLTLEGKAKLASVCFFSLIKFI